MFRKASPPRDGNTPRIAVIGGGISGLAAVRKLLEVRPGAEVILIEANDRLGGVLKTERRDGFLIEHAADNFITTPPFAVDFSQRLGFRDQLIETNDTHRRAFVVNHGKLKPVPAGFAVMTPSRIWPIASTSTLSLRAKLRMACEFFIKPRVADGTESLAAFVRRRFGREMYDHLVQPLIAGIYTGDAEKISIGATLPRFLEMEKEHGSLIRATLKQRRAQRQAVKQSSGARYSQFMAPKEGMSAMVQAIVDQLTAAKKLLNSRIEKMLPNDQGGWLLSIEGDNPQTLDVDGVVLATPAHHSAAILQDAAPDLASEFSKINYGSCALVSLGFRRDQIKHPLDGFGFVVPAIEDRQILSASFTSIKYTGRAPDGQVLLRAFVGGACQSNLIDLDDQQLETLVTQELSDLLKINGKPTLCHIVRQKRAMPQYYVGHEQIVERIQQQASALPNFAIAGNALSGIGIPNCIQAGEKAAADLLTARIKNESPMKKQQYQLNN